MDRADSHEICGPSQANQFLPHWHMSFEQRDKENGNVRNVVPSEWSTLPRLL